LEKAFQDRMMYKDYESQFKWWGQNTDKSEEQKQKEQGRIKKIESQIKEKNEESDQWSNDASI